MEEKVEETESQKREKAKKLEKQIIILFAVLAIIFIAYFVTSGIIRGLFLPKPYFEYEGLKVYPAKLTGVTTMFYLIPISGGGQRADVVLRNDPRKFNISVETGTLLDGINKVWVTTPPNLSSDAILAANEIGSFTTRISLDTSYALTESDTEFYPEMTCENATKETRVFMVNLGNETKVYPEGDCIIIQGENYDSMIKAADALVVNWILKLS